MTLGTVGDYLAQTEARGRVLTGAEAQAWVDHHRRLARARPAPAPARPDQESAIDEERFEVSFPRSRPILGLHPAQRPPTRSHLEAPFAQAAQPRPQLRPPLTRA